MRQRSIKRDRVSLLLQGVAVCPETFVEQTSASLVSIPGHSTNSQ